LPAFYFGKKGGCILNRQINAFLVDSLYWRA
jgi:hypothetical protein